jgi:hypothetical protein
LFEKNQNSNESLEAMSNEITMGKEHEQDKRND